MVQLNLPKNSRMTEGHASMRPGVNGTSTL